MASCWDFLIPMASKVWFITSAAEWIPSESMAPDPVKKNAPSLVTVMTEFAPIAA